MTEPSRLTTTAHALGLALESLGDALAQARHDTMAASQALLDERVREFRAAAEQAPRCGDVLAADAALVVTTALSRCRRLGFSLSLLTGHVAAPSDPPRAYTPAGHRLPHTDGGSLLTARG